MTLKETAAALHRPWYTDQVFPVDDAEIEIKDPAFPDGGRLFGASCSETADGALSIALDDEQPAFDGGLPEEYPRQFIFFWDKGRGAWVNESSMDTLQQIVWRYTVAFASDTRHVAPPSMRPSSAETHDAAHPWDCACGERYATAVAALDCRRCRKYLSREDFENRVVRNVNTSEDMRARFGARKAWEEGNLAIFDTFEEARIAAAARVVGHPAWLVVPCMRSNAQSGWAVQLDPTNHGHWMLVEGEVQS